MLHALFFDFDGLILDTETPEVDVWRSIYAEHGFDFPVEQWGKIVGGYGLSDFDAALYLQELLGQPQDVEAVRARHRRQSDLLVQEQPVLPGVLGYLDDARRLGLRLAIVSSSPHDWVDTHLTRLGLFDYFERIVCGDDVQHTKPAPDLFLKALECMGLRAEQGLVFEDSPNGVQAARAAALRVVAVPNPTTVRLRLDEADLILNSLADLSLEALLARLGYNHK
jgi:HAD superfamily hydrolase (TIGR01509 family)